MRGNRDESFTGNGENYSEIRYAIDFCEAIGKEGGYLDGAIQNRIQFDCSMNVVGKGRLCMRRPLNHAKYVTRAIMAFFIFPIFLLIEILARTIDVKINILTTHNAKTYVITSTNLHHTYQN